MFFLSLRFIACYVFLLMLGASLPGATRICLQDPAESLYAGTGDRWELNFEPRVTPAHPSAFRVEIANRALLNRNGSGPVRNLDLDAADLIAKPLALAWALILCTSVSWRRRFVALGWCAIWVQLIAIAVVGLGIWSESARLSLSPMPQLVQMAAAMFRQMVAEQLDLAVPVLLWAVMIFRRDDQRVFRGLGSDARSDIPAPALA